MINNNKVKNNILKILMLSLILIASIAVTMIIQVLATELEGEEVTNVNDSSTIVARYSAGFTTGPFHGSYANLCRYSTYCLALGKAVPDGHYYWSYSVDLKTVRGGNNIIPYAVTFQSTSGGDSEYNLSQWAVWGVTNSARFNELYIAGSAVNTLEEQISAVGMEPKVTPVKENESEDIGCGTVYENGKYIIGPFEMSDYAYVASSYVETYSGSKLSVQPDLVGGIASGYITLKDDEDDETTVPIGTDGVAIRYATEGDKDRRADGADNGSWKYEDGTTIDLLYEDYTSETPEGWKVTGYRTLLNGEEVEIEKLEDGRIPISKKRDKERDKER